MELKKRAGLQGFFTFFSPKAVRRIGNIPPRCAGHHTAARGTMFMF